MLKNAIEKRWYGKPGVLLGLLPLEWLFSRLSKRRKHRLLKHQIKVDSPVVVVGNIAVGGTGKTPTIIALIRALREHNINPGVITKGHGRTKRGTYFVSSASKAQDVGDEPLLIFKETLAPVLVGENRVTMAQRLAESKKCDLILCDDGFQDYSLYRDYEIALIDGYRMHGNGHLLPVGPLRESPERLTQSNVVLINGHESLEAEVVADNYFQVAVEPLYLENVKTGERRKVDTLKQLSQLAVVAGLGNPDKFFKTISQYCLNFEPHPFPDHHDFSASDFKQFEQNTVVMTSKDAVKCRAFAKETWWSLVIALPMPSKVIDDLVTLELSYREDEV